MKTEWPSAGAVTPQPVQFGDPRAEAAVALSGTVAAPLTHEGVLVVRGADATAFLQGQFSNDVQLASAALGQLTSYNSPKGRMLAVIDLRVCDEGYELWLEGSLAAAVLKRLRMYVLRSKVTLEDATPATAAFGVAGPGAESALNAIGMPAPATARGVAAAGDVSVTRRPGAIPRFSVQGPVARIRALWRGLPDPVAAVGTAAWRLLDIEAGLPTIHPATQDRFVAQMCNLDELGGISFSKGCYTGQEVVARVHYLGAVKRRMRRVVLAGDPPVPGARLDEGEVVDAAPLPEGCAALVVGASP